MRPGIPWSVKGIDDDARQAAKLAARKAGMTLGEWLNSMIKESSDEGASEHQPPPAIARAQSSSRRAAARHSQHMRSTSDREDDADLARRLDSLAGQLSQITEHNQQTAVSRFLEPARAQPQNEPAIQNLIDRVVASEQASTQALGQLNARLDNISGRIEAPSVAAPAMPQKPEDVPGFTALESAMRNIVDHIETSEASTRETLKTVQQRMADMAARAAEATVAGQDHNAPAISSLEQRIGELTARLEKSHVDTTREVQQYVQGQVNQLAERIDAVRHSTDAIAGQAQAVATQAAKNEGQQLEVRLKTIIGELQGNQSQDPEVARIYGELESLNQRYDDIKSQSVSETDITSLRDAVDQLVGKVSEAPTQQIEERMAELNQRLDNLDTAGITPQLTDLEQRVQAMDTRLHEAISQPGDIGSANRLKDQISIVNERLASTEAKLSHLTTIEQAIEQLYKSLEENRDWARQTAEDAAQHMAQQMTTANSATGVHAGSSPELQALENGLLAVKASADEADQRTQDTLEAVHDTLEQIINKLAQIEQQPPTAAASTQAAPLADLQNLAVDMPGQQTDAIAGQPADQDPFAIDPIQPEPLMEQGVGEFVTQPSVDDEHTFVASPPLAPEVGIAEPELSASENLDLSGQASTTPLAEQHDEKPGLPGDEVREDFIAAARMAAKNAASQNSSILGGLNALTGRSTGSDEDNAKPGKIGSLFSFPFRRKPDTAAAEESHEGTAATQDADEPETTSGRRRQLILAGLVLLAAVSAYTMGGVGKKLFSAGPGVGTSNIASQQQPVSQENLGKSPMEPVKIAPAQQEVKADQTAGAAPVSLLNKSSNLSAPDQVSIPDAQSTLQPADETTTQTAASTYSQALESAGQTAGPESDANFSLTSPAVAATPPAGSLISEDLGALSLREAAASGDANAQFVVASRYLDGKVIDQDFAKAAEWYSKAASQGLAPAQYRYGTLFERGRGVTKNIDTARLWYERAAERQNVKAMHNLAVIYSNNDGNKAEFSKAAKWFRAAADHGLKDSLYNLAVLYERGLGVTQDSSQAYFWYGVAARHGDADAKAKVVALKSLLADKQEFEIDSKIAAWAPQKPDRAGNFVAISDPSWNVAVDAPSAPTQSAGAFNGLTEKDLVMKAQELLAGMGYDVGPHDGVMGTRTANAVRLFQLQTGMDVNGNVSPKLVEALVAKRS